MPKPTVAPKTMVTRRPAADPVDQAERQLQAEHHQAAEADPAAGASPSTETAQDQDLESAPEPEVSPALEAEAESTSSQEPSRKQRKREEQREANAVQAAFLAANLGKPITVFTLNGVRLVGRLRQFDPYCLLLEGPAPMLVFKHGISTIAPAR